MATRKGVTVTTTVSFQVTFELPKGMNIPQARESVKEALRTSDLLIPPDQVKVHLTNKEMRYGKR